MTVKAATISPEKLAEIFIYLNSKHYTEQDTGKILQETGADFLIGGPIFLWDPKTRNPKLPKAPCCHLKADGAVLCAPAYTVPAGIPAWDKPADWGVSKLPCDKGNYIQCVPLIRGGKAVTPLQVQPDMAYRCPRQAIGGKDGRIAYYASTVKYTPEEFQKVLLDAGWEWAEMLDGGGSVVFASKDGGAIRCDPGRVLYSYICFKLAPDSPTAPTDNDRKRAKVLATARAEIGVTELPAGSNRVKYNDWFYGRAVSGAAYPWCMAFIQWVFAFGGLPLPLRTASCTALASWARTHGQLVKSGYKAGDIVFMRFSGSAIQHVGIVESVRSGALVTIEGNTGAEDDANGGQVQRRTRRLACVVSAYRPWYNV